MQNQIICTNCHRYYPDDELPYRCSVCGGIFDLPELPPFDLMQLETDLPGIWRYQHTFGLPNDIQRISLGEGQTPLVWADVFDRQIGFKLDFLNPSGSYKDRGSSVLISLLQYKGVTEAVEDSSGNAGASFAAYSAKAGIRARVYAPESTSGPKLKQVSVYGAEIIRVPGPRSNASEEVRKIADQGAVYASHAYLPHGLVGYASLAYELFEQMGSSPGTIVVPAGQGNLLLAIGRGFQSLKKAGLIQTVPSLVGVQARVCAPLWAVYQYGIAGLSWVTEGETQAEGVRVKHPLRGDAILKMLADTNGSVIAVDEQDILPGRDTLARQGLYVEPTSAIVWNALSQIIGEAPEPIVCVLTGSGLKSNL